MEYKTFDWERAKEIHHPEMLAFLKRIQRTEFSEQDFVNVYQTIPVKGGNSKRGRRSPSYARQQYRNLRDKFGFFK